MAPAPPVVIRLFARLKWRLVLNSIRRTRSWALPTLAVVFAGLVAVVGFVAGATGRQAHDPAVHRGIAIALACTVFVVWTFGSLLTGGTDETVDVSRLALLPLRPRDLAVGLATAALVGVAPAAALVALTGLIAGYAPGGLGAVLVVAAVVVAFASGLCASRAMATILARAQRSRRGRDLSVVLTAAVGATLWLGSQLIGRVSASAGQRVVDTLAWTPPGLLGQGVVDAAAGRDGAAGLRILAGAAWAGLFAWWWFRGSVALLVDPGTAAARRRAPARATATAGAGTGPPTVGLRARTPLGAAVAKELRYLVRSPSRRSQALISLVIGAGLFLVQLLRQDIARPEWLVLLAPVAGLPVSMGAMNNQLGFDSASLWLEVEAGGPGRTELTARGLSWVPAFLAPVLVGAIVVAALSGGWALVPVAIVLAAAAVGVPLGVGAYVSTIVPLPVPDAANPFVRRGTPGRGCAVGLVAAVANAVELALLAPMVVAVVVAYRAGEGWLVLTLVPVAAYGALVWQGGVGLAARRLRGREPELLVALDIRNVT